MKWCVEFPEESILLVRPSLKRVCLDNKPAAKLLSVLLYRYSIRKEAKEDAENLNEVKQARGETPDQDTSFRIYRKQAQLVTDAVDEMDEKTLHDVAVPTLQLLGYLDIEEHPGVHCYIVHLDRVQEALDAWKKGPKQLELFLKQSPQLEKVLISIQLEKVLINKKIFQLELEKVLIGNRNISNNKRGRKPKPEAPQEPQSEEPQISIEITEIGKEESSAGSSEPAAPASSSQSKPIDFEAAQERKRQTDPALPVVKPSQILPPQSQAPGQPDVAPPASVASTVLPSAGQDLPAMALTAKQIKQQNERRAKDIWAIIERERQTKYRQNQRDLYENREGIKYLIDDDIDDDTLVQALKAMDTYQRRNFTVLKFYGWIPSLTANESPPPNGKASAGTDKVTTLYRNKSEELAAQREKYAAQGGY